MSGKFPISVAGELFQPDQQDRSNKLWMRALEGAHRQSTTFCHCSFPRVHVSVKCYNRDTPSCYYDVARWPDTGLDHHVDCRFFGEEGDAKGADGSKPAFEPREDGMLRAHLALSLSLTAGSPVEAKTEEVPGRSPKASRARASEVSLLQRLWREAGLNVYPGEPREWFHGVLKILATAKRIVVSRSGATLADHLLLGATANYKRAAEHNAGVLVRCAETPSRLFVVGRLRPYDSPKTQCLLPLRESIGLPKILVQTSQLSNFLGQRAFLRNMLADRNGNVVVIACIAPAGGEWWKVQSIAGITCTSNLIPVDSSFEVEFQDYLSGQGRKFIKPMVNSEIDTDGNRPDFILLDTEPRVRCEVWGMQTPEYLAGKAERIARYRRMKQTLVSWSANPREPFPALPPPIRKQ